MQKMIFLLFCGLFFLNVNSIKAQFFVSKVGQDIDGEAAGDASGTSVSFSSDGQRVAIGANNNAGNGLAAGHVRVYAYNSSNMQWEQLGQDIDGETADDKSGYSVSLSSDGQRVAIGAPDNDSNGENAGHVRVYAYNSSNMQWEQLGQDIDGEAAFDQSGRPVSLSSDGQRVAIGAPSNSANGLAAGHVRVYAYNSSNMQWEQLGQDIDGETEFDTFGRSVSFSADGQRVAIGAPGSNSGNGHVRVYAYNSSNMQWEQLGQNIGGNNQFGYSVSLSSDGQCIAIGTPRSGNVFNAGRVWVYAYNSSNMQWEQLGQDIDGEAANDQSGWSVSLSSDGQRVAIGAFRNTGNGPFAGHVRVYAYNSSNMQWEQLAQDIDGKSPGVFSGFSVSLSADGQRVAIGAPGASGHVRVYDILPFPIVNVAIATPTIDEDAGQNFAFQFTRDQTDGDLTVYFSVGGTVTATDYMVQTGGTGAVGFDVGNNLYHLTFPNGDNTVDLTIQINNDNIVEVNETLVVQLEPAP